MIDLSNATVHGHIVIRDKQTREVLRDQENAVHFGNISASITKALAGDDAGHIRYMAFGNGGTTVSAAGEISYKEPNVSVVRNDNESLYNETFSKEIDNSPGNTVTTQLGNTNYSDIIVNVTLDFIESGLLDIQNPVDSSTNLETDTVFDELALYTGVSGITSSLNSSTATLITHVIFSPIEKSANRELEIDYTLRIQMG